MLYLNRLIPQRVKNWYHCLRAVLANLYFGFPGRKLVCIGVTGTNGKTTTCYFIHSILTVAGKRVGMVTSVEARVGEKSIETGLHVTSPDTWELQRLLRRMVREGLGYVVLEVTSHAIDQHRFWGVGFKVAVLTNVTHEHLDYHGSFEKYKQTKLGFLRKAEYSVRPDTVDKSLIEGIELKLAGDYNRENALAAAGVASIVGIDQAAVKKGLEMVKKVPGRMETVYEGDFKVIIDFAHTPDALEKALSAGRKLTKRYLIVVFGSAGERDIEKRPLMGEVAGQLADVIVLTAEDPRSEDVHAIIDQIAQGALGQGLTEINFPLKRQRYYDRIHDSRVLMRVPDRQEAVNLALREIAQPGDVVVICGKGHEKSMNFGGVEHPWSDFKAVEKALSSKL